MSDKVWARVLDGGKVRLDHYETNEHGGLDKESARPLLEKLGREFQELANLLSFAGQNALLVILQGRDASGKDGAIRGILDYSNVQSAYVHAFKVPSEEERAHDFLWRVHKAAPGRGQIALFNRSHYEDVIAARVHDLVPKETWRGRFDHINAFERVLTDNGTIILKFYLHIGRQEQIDRLLEREEAPRTAWKLNVADWEELPLWDHVTKAYEDVLERCASKELPWHLVAADRKWFRNLAIMERLVATLRPYRKGWVEHLEKMGKQALADIEAIKEREKVKKRRKDPG